MNAYSITVIPTSWRLGKYIVRNKTLWALGPLRFVLHENISSKNMVKA